MAEDKPEVGWLKETLERAQKSADQLPKWVGGTGKEHTVLCSIYSYLIQTGQAELAARIRDELGYVPSAI